MIHAYYKSEKWEKIRKDVLKRDGGICKKCNSRKATEVHHLHYRNWMNEKLIDLISFCRKCHQEEHDRINKEIEEELEFEDWWSETKTIGWEKIMND